MQPYSIAYKPSAAKAFRKIHPNQRSRIKKAIEALATNPHPQGSTQLSGGNGEYRIRVGNYRVVYGLYGFQVGMTPSRPPPMSSMRSR